jgi:[protein-PII] uridylyltransferase
MNLINDDIRMMTDKRFTGRQIVKTLSDNMDTYILSRLPSNIQSLPIAIYATGGYGRSELAPYSDVDLMFFSIDDSHLSYVKDIYYTLLDSGINISHSFRTLKDCLDEAQMDVKTKTSLINSRFIAGSLEVNSVYEDKVAKELIYNDQRSFFTALYKENKNRHARFGQSIYLLEPNIKESVGCLRDIHEVLWFVKAAHHINSFDDLQRILTKYEFVSLLKSYDFLLRLRIAIHILSGRGNNILYYSMRNDAAGLIGIRDSKKFTASERLLRFFFLRAKTVEEICAKIKDLSFLRYIPRPKFKKTERINNAFSISQNRIFANSLTTINDDPCRAIEAYLIHSKTGKKLSLHLRHLIKRNLRRINNNVRNTPSAIETFIEIFKGDRVYETLLLAHQDGVLDRFIPEFGALRSLIVDSPFHIYTVDAHTLLSIKELELLSKTCDRGDLILNQSMQLCNEKYILYIALLFHDIGKASGRLHATEGYKSLKYILDRFRIGNPQRGIIEFLVKNHLIMSDIAMNRDIEEPEVIIKFAETCQTETMLRYLLLITYADMKAVNPEFLSLWKKCLLLDLFEKVLGYIRGIRNRREEYIKEIILSFPTFEEYLNNMSTIYLVSSSIETIKRDIFLIYEFQQGRFEINIEHKKDKITEITVPAKDRSGLLADIVGIFSHRQLSIITLRTFSVLEGLLIDRIHLSNWSDVAWDGMEKEIRDELKAVILDGKSIKLYNAAKICGLTDSSARLIAPFIEVDNELSTGGQTVFEIISSDYIGLLHKIATVFSVNKMDIRTARINTESSIVHDVFYVTKDYKPLTSMDIFITINEIWGLLV